MHPTRQTRTVRLSQGLKIFTISGNPSKKFQALDILSLIQRGTARSVVLKTLVCRIVKADTEKRDNKEVGLSRPP